MFACVLFPEHGSASNVKYKHHIGKALESILAALHVLYYFVILQRTIVLNLRLGLLCSNTSTYLGRFAVVMAAFVIKL